MSLVGRLARPTVAAAAIATGYTVYTAQPALADDAAPRSSFGARPGRASNGDKLPIYETNSEPLVTLVEVDNPLTPYIAQARVATTDALASTSAVVKTGVSRWIDFERKAEREIKTVLPNDEALTPGIIYVLIAGLSGSVLTRTRAFPVRWLTPPLFTLAAMPYFLPKTAHNLRAYFSDVEDKYAPALAEKHDILNSRLSMHWEMAKDKLGSASEEAQGLGQRAVRGIESNTGLKIGDALKRGQDKVHEQKERLAGGGVRVGTEPVKMETVGFVVETKPVAEIVAPVQADAAPAAIPSPSLNVKAEVEKPNVVPAKTPEAAVQAVVAEEVIPGAVPVAATTAPVKTPAVQAAKPVETKPKEENRRLV